MSVNERNTRRIASETRITRSELDLIERQLRDSLQESERKSTAVADTFYTSIEKLSEANPTDVWNYGVYRSYLSEVDCSSPHQSWRRVSGSAFEHFVADYYNRRLPRYLTAKHVSDTEVADTVTSVTGEKAQDVLDVAIFGEFQDDLYLFAGVNTMTSIRGRLQNYYRRSDVLRKSNLSSLVVTLDSHLSEDSVRSEAEIVNGSVPFTIVEDYACFDSLYSFNQNTDESEQGVSTPVRSVGQSRFNDRFVEDVIQQWEEFVSPLNRKNLKSIDT